jgi:hypothetical protein
LRDTRQFLLRAIHETGKAERCEIADTERAPLEIPGIWEHKQDGPNSMPLLSMSMLTIC